MSRVFSSVEIVEMGIKIEENGRDFYSGVASLSQHNDAKETFEHLAGEEKKHIDRFKEILSYVKKFEPAEAYPGEYFSYIKSLASEYIFTEDKKGLDIAKKVNTDMEAIRLGIGFEKDSILLYEEMKKFVFENEQNIIDKLIEEEKTHLRKLSSLIERLN